MIISERLHSINEKRTSCFHERWSQPDLSFWTCIYMEMVMHMGMCKTGAGDCKGHANLSWPWRWPKHYKLRFIYHCLKARESYVNMFRYQTQKFLEAFPNAYAMSFFSPAKALPENLQLYFYFYRQEPAVTLQRPFPKSIVLRAT